MPSNVFASEIVAMELGESMLADLLKVLPSLWYSVTVGVASDKEGSPPTPERYSIRLDLTIPEPWLGSGPGWLNIPSWRRHLEAVARVVERDTGFRVAPLVRTSNWVSLPDAVESTIPWKEVPCA